MPILDCEPYSLSAMEAGALQMLWDSIQSSGVDPETQPIAYANIYFGMQQLHTVGGTPWWVCVPRPNGLVTILVHQVRHGDVVVTTLPELAESRGLCFTLIWTSQGDLAIELADALQCADNLVKQVEMLFGVPIPLPLSKAQLPDRFAVRTIDPRNSEWAQTQVSVLIPPDDHGVAVDEQTVANLGHLVEALGPIAGVFQTPMEKALLLSSRWQGRAIRALGLEDWGGAIVASNTWIETMMVQLATLLNEADGRPIEDVQGAIMRGGLSPNAISKMVATSRLRW